MCATVTAEFLSTRKQPGTTCRHLDLIRCRAEPGDGVVCAARWLQAAEAGYPCPVRLAATHERALDVVPLELLRTRV